jgi:hypothetical protein
LALKSADFSCQQFPVYAFAYTLKFHSIVVNNTIAKKGGSPVARPKMFHGGNVGVRLPKEVDIRLRATSLETGRSLADLIREALMQDYGAKAKEARAGQ